MMQRVESRPVRHGTRTGIPVPVVFVPLNEVAHLRQRDLEGSSVDDLQEPAFVPSAFSAMRFVESPDGARFPFPAEQEPDRAPGNVRRIFPVGTAGPLRKVGGAVARVAPIRSADAR